jgi:hypothetical protein
MGSCEVCVGCVERSEAQHRAGNLLWSGIKSITSFVSRQRGEVVVSLDNTSLSFAHNNPQAI